MYKILHFQSRETTKDYNGVYLLQYKIKDNSDDVWYDIKLATDIIFIKDYCEKCNINFDEIPVCEVK